MVQELTVGNVAAAVVFAGLGILAALIVVRLAYHYGYLKACNDINEALEREHRLTWERHQREISDANKAVQQQQSMTGRRPDGL